MPDDKYFQYFGFHRRKKDEKLDQDKDMDNNPKLSEMEKGNKGSMKKKSYGKSAEEENRSLLKNGMPDDSMIMTNSSKSK